jgi:hypothetical protein
MAAVQQIHGMRRFLIAFVVGCGGATNAPAATTSRPTKHVSKPREPIDVIATLSKPLTEAAAIVPGPAELVLGGPPLQAVEGAAPVRGVVVEEQGNDLRIGVQLASARFALWMPRSRMLGVIKQDIRVPQIVPLPIGSAVDVTLRAGAQVRRLARKDNRVNVRYVGALEVEGWLPNDAVGDSGPIDRRTVFSSGAQKLMVLPGAIIRAEPKWAGQQLAVVNKGYILDTIKVIDDAWVEVEYADQDVSVRGYVSKRDPPGRIHRPPPVEASNPIAAPNANAPTHTCLFIHDEPIGFLDGAQPVLLEPGSRVGWQTVTIETPWHAIAFDVKGTSAADLTTCGQ